MDSLANYGSDGDNSDYSEDPKNNKGRSQAPRERSNDVNYDPVQMDMSEDSNNNHSSGENSNSEERAKSPSSPQSCSRSKQASSRRVSSDQRSSAGEERHRGHDRHIGKSSSRRDHHHQYKDRRSRGDEESRRREKSSSSRDERRDDRDYRDDRRDDRDYHRDERREKKRERERRHSRSERSKDRHRDDALTGSRSQKHHKDKRSRTRSRSRSKSKDKSVPSLPPPSARVLSYREEKGRSKLAQLEKLGIELKTPEGISLTALQGMEPSFYNPLATATQGKYAEQIQKRKLLWANKAKQDEGKSTVASTAPTSNTWVGTTFVQDQDGKMTAKFKRLMGIKGEAASTAPPGPGEKPDILKKQEEMFSNMEQQYEVARATTHTQRGVGLGYASGGYQFSR